MLLRLIRTAADAARALAMALLRRRDLALENLALRQQLASVCSKPHSRPGPFDRAFWGLLPRVWPAWRTALGFVRPETVVRWHRQGFRLFWRLKSHPNLGRPPVDHEIRRLIFRMASENPWGAPRVHAELLKLGFDISQATVERYMPRPAFPRRPTGSWSTFLRLHLDSSVGIDFFDIPTATFEILRGFLVINHKSRRILHVGITKHPTEEWAANHLLEAFPFDDAPRFLFRDRDSIFGSSFRQRVWSMGVAEAISEPQSPWQNPFAERVIGTIRRELLDHVIVLNERHAVRLLREYVEYYNKARPHLSLEKDSPQGRQVMGPERGAEIVPIDVLGGLHHRYARRAA